MNEINLLKKQLEEEKKKNKLLAKQEEAEKLKKELNYYKKQNNPYFNKLKKTGKFLGNFLDNIEKDKAGITIGDKVVITNGTYSGETLKITGFISGGITGMCNGKVLNIRHGSYKRI